MLFNLYECDDFYDDENGEQISCEEAFWANSDDLTICPNCGNESLKIIRQSNFVEKNVEVTGRYSEYGFAGENLIKEIEKALGKYHEDNVDMSIKEEGKNQCRVKVFYHDRHDSFDLSDEIVVDLSFEQLIKICDNYNIGYQED